MFIILEKQSPPAEEADLIASSRKPPPIPAIDFAKLESLTTITHISNTNNVSNIL